MCLKGLYLKSDFFLEYDLYIFIIVSMYIVYFYYVYIYWLRDFDLFIYLK